MEKRKITKEILAVNTSVVWFSLTLFKEKLWDRCNERIEELIDDPEVFDVFDFECFDDAEEFMLDALVETGYYYGMICYIEYDYDSEAEDNLGKCNEWKCIAEAWSDDIEEEVIYYE